MFMSVKYRQRLAMRLYQCNMALKHSELDEEEQGRLRAEMVTIKAKQRGE